MQNTDAGEIAAKRMDNLNGKFESLKGSMETVGIELGMKVIPALSSAADMATKGVNAFEGLDGSTQGLLLGMGALTVAMPALVTGGEKFVGMLKSMHGEGMTAQGALTGIAVGIGAVSVAADVILQKTTGHGLIETLFGDPASADRVAAAIDRITAASEAGSDKVVAGLREVSGAYQENQKHAGDLLLQEMQHVEISQREKDAIDATVTALGGKKAKYEDLQKLLQGLTPAQQDYLQSTSAMTLAVNAHKEALVEENAKLADNLALLPQTNDAIATVTDTVKPAKSAFDAWVGTLKDGADEAKEFNNQMDIMAQRFSTANPTAIAVRGELAAIDEELADLAVTGGTWSATLDKTKAQLEATKAKDEEYIKSLDANEAAQKATNAALELYLGQSGLMGLDQAIEGSTLSLNDQVNAQKLLTAGLTALSTNDVPGAVEAFNKLKAKLSPAEWNEVVKALGPEMARVIQAGFSGPEWTSVVQTAANSGVSVGTALMQGVSSALLNGSGGVLDDGKKIIDDLKATMQLRAESSSPSKLFAREVGLPLVQGIAKGMLDGEGGVLAQASKIVADTMSAAKAAVDTGSAAIGGGPYGDVYDPKHPGWYTYGGGPAPAPVGAAAEVAARNLAAAQAASATNANNTWDNAVNAALGKGANDGGGHIDIATGKWVPNSWNTLEHGLGGGGSGLTINFNGPVKGTDEVVNAIRASGLAVMA
jgi:hypothetical protein